MPKFMMLLQQLVEADSHEHAVELAREAPHLDYGTIVRQPAMPE